MTANNVRTALRWFTSGSVPMTELELFKTAYFAAYHEAHKRCMWCFSDYSRFGTVPRFVRDFIVVQCTV